MRLSIPVLREALGYLIRTNNSRFSCSRSVYIYYINIFINFCVPFNVFVLGLDLNRSGDRKSWGCVMWRVVRGPRIGPLLVLFFIKCHSLPGPVSQRKESKSQKRGWFCLFFLCLSLSLDFSHSRLYNRGIFNDLISN